MLYISVGFMVLLFLILFILLVKRNLSKAYIGRDFNGVKRSLWDLYSNADSGESLVVEYKETGLMMQFFRAYGNSNGFYYVHPETAETKGECELLEKSLSRYRVE